MTLRGLESNGTCLHLVERERAAKREVLVVVHVLAVADKSVQRNAGVGVALQDLVVELSRPIAIPAMQTSHHKTVITQVMLEKVQSDTLNIGMMQALHS